MTANGKGMAMAWTWSNLLWILLVSGAAADSGFWRPPIFSRQDSLFIIAATGEPRFQGLRDSCEKILKADTGTMGYLIRCRLQGQTPRQRHYFEKLAGLISDSGKNAEPRRKLAEALGQNSDSLRARILYIGSRMGDSAFRREALPYLQSASEPVRRMAMRCLGAYPHLENLPLIWNGLEKCHGLELQQRLWALEQQGPLTLSEAKARLSPLLRDSLFCNRQKARDLLLRSADSSWSRLRTMAPRKNDAPDLMEWILMARDAKGGKGFLKRFGGGDPSPPAPLPH
jgi:hypothetical protein